MRKVPSISGYADLHNNTDKKKFIEHNFLL